MAHVDDLKEGFDKLTEEEKLEFFKKVMPSFCNLFSRTPGKMMSEMMPWCQEMMKTSPAVMPNMMSGMMGMMGASKCADKS